MIKVRVKVTQEHIDKGVRTEAHECPISLAASHALGLHVGVDQMGIAFYPQGIQGSALKGFRYPVIPSFTKFVYDYDSRLPVAPFSFILKFSDKFSKNFNFNPDCIVKE